MGEFLITDTNSKWDGISGSCLIKVNANDVIGVRFSATALTNMDSTAWSIYTFDWFEQRVL